MRLLEVGLANAIGLAPNEIVTYSFIRPESVGLDMHPLTILTEGSAFSYPGPYRGVTAKSRRLGKKIYERFIALVTALQPAYAAITVEYSLECPTDLRYDPRSAAFRDFFVSMAYVGESDLRQIKKISKDAYMEAVGDGLYVSCFAPFNPLSKELRNEIADANSGDIAKVISRHGDFFGRH